MQLDDPPTSRRPGACCGLRLVTGLLLGGLCFGLAQAQEPLPWSTYRGNPQRTGNTDGRPGPRQPRVLWMLPAREHFLAAAVPAGDCLFLSGLGGFNVPTLYCLETAPQVKARVRWSKSAPFLKLPIVSSPAQMGDYLIFGDGMHQTDGATLFCVQRQTGLPLWQLPLPGQLVHLEGGPSVADGRVYVGGGAAGVLCLDARRVRNQMGRELDLTQAQQEVEQHWRRLWARYEADKKKDPDLAVPPSPEELPHFTPRQLWQQGAEKWHVDAPVAVVGQRVLVASAYLEREQRGSRLLACLEAGSGRILWSSSDLAVNPWGGPAVHGTRVVLTGSSIGYDLKSLPKARGQIAAFDLNTGQRLWSKTVPAGLVACAALAGDLAVTTATDGKVRAFDLASGERRWIYEAHAPFFAPVALAGGRVYAGDLKGVLHALDLASGRLLWTFDLAQATHTPGMIYGGPVVHAGRLYVATCNLEGPHVGQPTAVLCLADP